MPTSYPGAVDNFTNPTAGDTLNTAGVLHHEQHSNANDAIEAIEGVLGTSPAGIHSTVKDRIISIESNLGTISSQDSDSVSITGGTVNGTSIGATAQSSGDFTTLSASAAVTFTQNTASTSYTTGTVVVTGGVGMSGALYGNESVLDGFIIDGGTF